MSPFKPSTSQLTDQLTRASGTQTKLSQMQHRIPILSIWPAWTTPRQSYLEPDSFDLTGMQQVLDGSDSLQTTPIQLSALRRTVKKRASPITGRDLIRAALDDLATVDSEVDDLVSSVNAMLQSLPANEETPSEIPSTVAFGPLLELSSRVTISGLIYTIDRKHAGHSQVMRKQLGESQDVPAIIRYIVQTESKGRVSTFIGVERLQLVKVRCNPFEKHHILQLNIFSTQPHELEVVGPDFISCHFSRLDI
ncbi:hypothetical protein FA15DRAFT_711967 [Coprinopsis marcescibilis]|uniref:Uncharacterized protein n=1 Tax=Coprinopsis marcescibilis TaxID=230819 RepID=A0A5C3K901_COPMA|nr:hypothetical protein FA15DRAFT_711967 [Coprinopsis marcescibilis]